jgi:hypothetical protein
VTQANPKLDRLLAQGSFRTLGKLHNLRYRRFRLRVCPQLFHIRPGVFAADNLFRCLAVFFAFFVTYYSLML